MRLHALARRALAALAFVATAASAQGTLLGIKYQHLTQHTESAPGHYWLHWDRLFSSSDTGDNVAAYFQHYHSGNGPAFGILAEVQHYRGSNNVWAVEADLAVPDKHPDSFYRVGVGVVVAPPQGRRDVRAYASDGFLLIPWEEDQTRARVGYGLRIGIECEKACISIPAGEAIELSPDPAVGRLRFDPATGIVGFWRRDGLLVIGWNQDTGQEYRMRRFQ